MKSLRQRNQIGFKPFGALDLLVVTLMLAILSALFAHTKGRLLIVWPPTITLACILRLSKAGKPENFLVHWLRFQLRGSHVSAFQDPKVIPPRRRKHA